jgi:hypothetical protein
MNKLLPWWPQSSFKEAPAKSSGGGGSMSINPNTLKTFFVKAAALIAAGTAGRGEFATPEYDLAEIKAASETDSYIKMAVQKYSQLMFKAGYQIKGNNDAAVEYLLTRFRVMSFSTGTPMDILLQEISDDMVRYSNAFLVKARVDKVFGGIQAKGVLDVKPIGGYYRVDPATMQIKRDKAGMVQSYQQDVGDAQKKYKPTDVIHFFMDRDAGAAFGKPRFIAAVEDVKLLRKIEGNVLALIYRFSIPLYHWKIGLAQPGFQATDQEVNEAKYEIEKMTLDGSIVTNERTDITTIGAEGEALDASKYLAYFEKRVFAALGVSESQMGRGGAKQDADSMEAQQHNTVKNIQRVMSILIDNYLINELLLEGGFNPIENIDDVTNFEFNEISQETKIKKENHEILKFQSNLVTFEESRTELGYKQEADEARLFNSMITQPQTLEQIQAKADGAAQVAAARPTAGGTGGNGKTAAKKPSGAATSNNRPTNQHGTTSVKVKESTDTEKRVEKFHKEFSGTYKKYEDARNDIVKLKRDAALVLPITRDMMAAELKRVIADEFRAGAEQAWQDSGSVLRDWKRPSLTALYDIVDDTTKSLMKDLASRIKQEEHAGTAFETLAYRVRFLCEYIAPKAYWYGYVRTCDSLGIKTVEIEFDGSDDSKEHAKKITTSKFSLDDIPAFHAYCDCKVNIIH